MICYVLGYEKYTTYNMATYTNATKTYGDMWQHTQDHFSICVLATGYVRFPLLQ